MPLFNLNQNQQVTFPIPISIILGGTGASDAAGARANLDLEYAGRIGAPTTYGSVSIFGSIGGISGVNFPAAQGNPVFMQHNTFLMNGMWSATISNPSGGWMWSYRDGKFQVNSLISEAGEYIALDKSLGSLPGYPANRFPVVKSDNANLYFSIGGNYSSYITAAGTYAAMSDFNKKENIEEVDYQDILEKVKYLPVCKYSFKNSDSRIKSIGTFAQAFWLAFQLGGDLAILQDDSPTQPNKMLAPSDMAGVCLAAVKGLLERVEKLEEKTESLTN
ncbi:tail fiber domain-containing protein [Kamptonema formosum]|uniref:tail fiber domain-containing protein n=1 Tax=Kamptonema formosum TaxID=331992 RepID=UPI00034B1292|nr:tail fiber domain-containing protein [Kamptonema formosum]